VEERAGASRGWQLTTEIDENTLSFQLSDTNGNPIVHASGELTLFFSAENRVMRIQPTESKPGTYVLNLPAEIKGSLQARIEFEQKDARISRQLLVNL
jgi:nitrogen fixation protein FixH